MSVKALIERLLDEPMDSEVMIHTHDKHIDRFGQEVQGYAFNIDGVEHWSQHITFLNFIDYRKGADRPQGKWVDDGGIEKCSQCGERREFPHWNYCPNCGSFNGGEEE